MKYHKGECEICVHSRPKPLNSVTFVCNADTGQSYVHCNVITKNNVATRFCRYFKKEKEGSAPTPTEAKK